VSMTSDIQEIAQMIWETLFTLRLDPGGDRDPVDPSGVTSFVHIDGAWNGVVMVQCPLVLAEALAAAMFGAPREGGVDKIETADLRDALGEIANIVGGNVKALLPSPCHLSLAAVAIGSDYDLSIRGATEVTRVPFSCVGHAFVITVLEGRREPEPVG
jgi:chemotaxis protein CheX